MPYSLLTAVTLGFDLVRRPAGPVVAQMLLTALTADEALLARLARAHPAAASRSASYAVNSRRVREAAAQRRPPPPPPAAGSTATLGAWKRHLGAEPIGSVHAIERLLRQDILGPDHVSAADPDVVAAATDVLANAVLAAWAVRQLPEGLYQEAVEPYQQAMTLASQPFPDLGPSHDRLIAILAAPRQQAAVIAGRWAAAPAGGALTSGWAQAMHRACWAAHLSGRTRPVAAALLLAVQTFRQAELGPRELSGGLWNAFAGCIQATAVADLLDDESTDRLVGGWRQLVH